MMMQTKSSQDLSEKALQNFENIKHSIKGLYEIFDLSLEKEDFFHKAGTENVTGLYKNLIEMLLNDYGVRLLMKKIQNSELELDIDLNL